MKIAEKPSFRPLVYICAPFSGEVEQNTKMAAAFAKYAYDTGNIPLTMHLLFPFLDDTNDEDRRNAISMGLVLMGKCQEVWVLGKEITDGMLLEIERAKRRRQKIRYFNSYFNSDFQEVTE